MGRTIGYICTKKYSESQLFKGIVKADKFYIDLATDRGWSSYYEFNSLIEEVEKSDKVILPSIVQISEDLEEVYSLIGIFRNKGVKLTLLNPLRGEEAFLTEGGFKTLEAINKLRDLTKNNGAIEIKAENQIRHRESQEVFPQGFYQAFIDYKNNGLKAEEAAKKLKVDVYKFYRLVREFS